ncbi:unnamed protein product, partial [Caenorhabditis auriculariae]
IDENYCQGQAEDDSYRMQKGAFLNQKNETLRMEKARKLLFTDEKIFTVEPNNNGQNHRIIATDYQTRRRPRSSCQRDSRVVSRQFSEFISAADWPASSPDLNPMDYAVWIYLTEKTALIKKWDEIDDDYLRAVIDAYPKRLKAVIKC